MAKKIKKTAETPATTDVQTAPPPKAPKPVKLTPADIIRAATIDTAEERDALRKAVASTRMDLMATATEKPEAPPRYDVRYGAGRAMKQRPGEPEAVLFATARNLTIALLDMVDTAETNIEQLTMQLADRGEQITKLTADLTTATTERDAAKADAEAVKADLAKVAGELAVLKVETAIPEVAAAQATA